MARTEIERTVEQSVLDRLIDHEPRMAGDAPLTWSESVRQLKIGLRRDLEWLLNTRRIPLLAPDGCDELPQSLYHYGLPDITSRGRDAPETRRRVAREVEEAITLFEPRLIGTRVSLAEGTNESERRLHFVIEALLRLDPNPERVVFDTVLDMAKGEFEVQSTGGE